MIEGALAGLRVAGFGYSARPLVLPGHAVLSSCAAFNPRPLPAGFIAPCLPTKAVQPPSGGLWLHEIKHDGCRVIARKDGKRVRLYSRPGNDLTGRFRPWAAIARPFPFGSVDSARANPVAS